MKQFEYQCSTTPSEVMGPDTDLYDLTTSLKRETSRLDVPLMKAHSTTSSLAKAIECANHECDQALYPAANVKGEGMC